MDKVNKSVQKELTKFRDQQGASFDNHFAYTRIDV